MRQYATAGRRSDDGLVKLEESRRVRRSRSLDKWFRKIDRTKGDTALRAKKANGCGANSQDTPVPVVHGQQSPLFLERASLSSVDYSPCLLSESGYYWALPTQGSVSSLLDKGLGR